MAISPDQIGEESPSWFVTVLLKITTGMDTNLDEYLKSYTFEMLKTIDDLVIVTKQEVCLFLNSICGFSLRNWKQKISNFKEIL